MTRRPLPSGGGSYARDDKGKLKLAARTQPAAPAAKPAKPAASSAKTDQKEASE
ncbi:hypothetical protein SAMN04488105_1048 [Salipiger thiooxidans]|uniref:Uncharacterized protein n=1 Tax=Salipiger thiooxidans TaxID=282683 RepID=A0A1G7D4P5_9RHOB|nr:hypothetical protein [Salipiger thiooxidans]SDE46558.1 hypothetical protein SAMN04488105_1048 [Salipiger thiooxidans]